MWRRRMKENKKKLGDEIVINKTKILTFNLLEIRMDRLNALLLFLMRGLLSDSISRESLHSPNSNCRFFLLFRSFVCVCVYVSKINNGMCFTFALIVFDSSSFFFFHASFRAIYFWFVFVFIFISLEFQSLFISQKHASLILFVSFLFPSLVLFSHCTTHQSEIVVGVNGVDTVFRLLLLLCAVLCSFVFPADVRLMCTKSEFRVVWAPNQRQSAENKQMIRFSSVGVIFAKPFSSKA